MSDLPERVRRFVDAPRFATIATIDADGAPHQAVVWYLLRDDGLIVNSLVGRRWPANLLRDARFSLVVEDGLDHVVLAGTAEPDPSAEQAQADIAEMARRYEAPEDAERQISESFARQRRISFRLRPTRVHEYWEG